MLRCLTTRTAVLAAVCLPLTCGETAAADEVGFAYNGFVLQQFGDPWGFSIPPSSPVTGRFMYDPLSSPVSLGDCDCHAYRQQITNGFSATFGTITVQADHYIVDVSNDLPQSNGDPADLITIRFVSNLSPPLEGPLHVNGTVQTDGLFSLTLFGPDDVLEDSMLPRSLELSDFTQVLGILDDTPKPILLDILYSLTGLRNALPGDYDNGGEVEQSDLDLVLLNWGTAWPPAVAGWVNELPLDGWVDQNDLDGALLNWGSTSEGNLSDGNLRVGATYTVPEPGVGFGIGLSSLLSLLVRRRF